MNSVWKKILISIGAVFVIAAVGLFGYFADELFKQHHECDFAQTYSYDETYHWFDCTEEICDEVKDKTEHIDIDNDGLCDVCTYITGLQVSAVDLLTKLCGTDNILVVGETVVITDESVDGKLIITTDKILNFMDKVITLDLPNATNTTENWVGINVNAGVVVFDGTTGGIKTADNAELYAVVIRNGATLTINGGSYIGGTTAISVTNGTLVINDGFFEAQTDDTNYVINCIDTAYRSGDATVIIKGGTFVNFNPADNLAEGQGTNFVAEGYTVLSEVQDNGDIWYTVVAITE